MRNLRWIFLLIGLVPVMAINARGDTPATQMSVDDPPVPAAMAASYLAIGRDFSLQLSLVRKALGGLTLDGKTREAANGLLDSNQREVDSLVSQMKSGQMPGNRRVMAVPGNLQDARAKLYEMIGPEQGKVLDEIMQSLRGEARGTLGKLGLMIEDLKLPNACQCSCDVILAEAETAAERLPDRDVKGDEYDRQRETMNLLFAQTHDRLAGTMTPEEQARLGPGFTQLAANRPSTGPSQQKG